ncbi:S9 family peptidase [Thalassotalea sp. Y01]|uniref:S9 family peptidase n=1 Tax=Thalassotalea sp. Y01 TaxID=2729613 RepID=UPI00145F2493|nr:S9 family peptidase [Thalassotalea sp. Y01]NMP15590.1 S9 family peptidase [Thalassotalea sp. Y01]
MKKIALLLLPLYITGCSVDNEGKEQSVADEVQVVAPIAKKVPKKMQIHGDERIDNYYWLRDDTRSDSEILAHLQAEEDYAMAKLAHTQELQDTLYDEMISRLKKDDSSVPYTKNGYTYQSKFVTGGEYRIYSRVKQGGSEEQVLLDANVLAEGKDYYANGSVEVSPDNGLLAYSEDLLSRRVYTIKFKNIHTGDMLSDELTGTNGQIIWANDSNTVFYIKKDPQTLLGFQVYRHTLGTKQEDDVLMYEETDKSFYTWIGKSLDDQYIEIFHNSTVSLGVSLLDANNPDGEFKLAHAIERDLEYSVQSHGEDFYILTNLDAKNFKIAKVAKADVGDKSKWVDVIEHREDTLISGLLVLNDALIFTQRENGLMGLRVMDLNTGKVAPVEFDESLYSVYLQNNVDFNADFVRVGYQSMTTPRSVYDVSLDLSSINLKKQDEVLGGYDAKQYHSERIMMKARDGADIPVSVLYKKDQFKGDGTNPLLQYAYGSYGSTNDPFFSDSVISLVDRGFVYVVAHIRGSSMLGRKWYDNGKLLKKKNTFNDFVDVTRELVKGKYGADDKIFAYGGSAGGLLMGAVINQAPELYRGVVAAVPFVDVVTTMLDASIPLTTNEYDEWGNPNEKAYYDYMLSYSPYDNVEAKAYPNLLVTTGLHDSQVQYFEPAKWVAKLREMKTDDNELLFHINMEAGHGGVSGRYKRYKDRALVYAFMLDLLSQ